MVRPTDHRMPLVMDWLSSHENGFREISNPSPFPSTLAAHFHECASFASRQSDASHSPHYLFVPLYLLPTSDAAAIQSLYRHAGKVGLSSFDAFFPMSRQSLIVGAISEKSWKKAMSQPCQTPIQRDCTFLKSTIFTKYTPYYIH